MHDLDISRLGRLAINDQGFAFDPQTGESFTLNVTAREILRSLTAGQADRTIAETLAARYGLSERDARRDVHDFLEQLGALHLLEMPA